jgi:2,4-dienoyl-CoA reductase-like NADH-dependent reductase (Old Yellow Enzyme family)
VNSFAPRWNVPTFATVLSVPDQLAPGNAGVQELQEPIIIGGTRVPNRIVLASMTTRLADKDGSVTDGLIAYYRARVRGGVGLVTVEMASPEQVGRHRFSELGIFDDGFLPGLTRLVDALRSERDDVRLSIQLGHAGSRARSAVSGLQPIAPTSLPTTVFEVEQETIHPDEMTEEQIEETIESYVSAAARAQRAGFDFVELHGAHGYLISQFLTPFENRRTDAYGGTLANRARFPLEVIKRIKQDVPGLPVIFRIGVEDFFQGGMTPEAGVLVAAWAAEAGADAISVTAGHYRSLPNAERMIPPMKYPVGEFLPLAARVKAAVSVPVIGVGRLGDPQVAAEAVASGKIDLVALGRPLLADPEWVRKTAAGEPVRRCLSCNHCVNNMRQGDRISCVVNPLTGRELDFQGVLPARGKTIIVIGAGPAGLSYASMAAQGNRVEVVDRAPGPGGAFNYTGLAPRFNDVEADPAAFKAYIVELERDCRSKGVEFHYDTDAHFLSAKLAQADTVVIATGARYRFGLGAVARWLLRSGLARTPLGDQLFKSARLRNLLYYRIRKGSGAAITHRLRLNGPDILVIGDAAKAGKAREAIASAFEIALPSRPVDRDDPVRLNTTS